MKDKSALHPAALFAASLFVLVASAVSAGTKVIKNGDTLVFMGDSITKFGNDHAYGYLHLVVRGLAANGINVTWYGKGISGETAVQMKNRFQSNVLDLHPQVCTIFGGVNDCGAGWTLANDAGAASKPSDVAAMADMAIAAGVTPVLLSPTGVNGEDFKQNVCDYAAAVKNIAQTRNIPYAATYEAYRAYIDDPANPGLGTSNYKVSADGTHMSLIGDRLLAREVLKAFGLDETEMSRAEAEWNTMTALVDLHPSVKITAAEYKAVKVAAARAGRSLNDYQVDLFNRGVELMGQNPARVSATSGASVQFSSVVPMGFASYDQMISCGRTMSTHDSVPSIANYALLAAVHELPSVTDADLPTEPVQSVTASVFAKSITFTCSGYTGNSTLADFPVAVRLAAGSPSGFRYADMAHPANGNELRFADAGGHSLPYEIEEWNPNGTSLVWVKLPSLARNTAFTMYYGGTPADTVDAHWTWAADYVGVWHMTENGGTAFDSANGLHAKPVGAYASSMQTSTGGVFGKGRVNSSDTRAYQGQSMLQVDDSTLLDCGGDFTFSGWVKMTALPPNSLGRIASRNRGGQYAPDWELRLADATTLNGYAGSNTPVTGTVSSAMNNWVHIAGVFNGTTLTTYANGVQVFSTAIPAVLDSDNKLVFGAFDLATPNGHFVGNYDEFRLRDAVSSADWIKAEYDQAGSSFLTTGAQGEGEGEEPAVDPAGALTPSGDATGVADAAAIQSALDAAKTAGGTVSLGSGVFYINTQLMVDGGVTLEGQGWDKTVVKQVATGDNKRVATISGGSTVKKVAITGGSISTDSKYLGGGGVAIVNGTLSWCCVTNNLLVGGNAVVGGGVGFYAGKGQVDHSIIAGNTISAKNEVNNYGGGIGVFQASGAITIDSCLIADNAAVMTKGHRSGRGGGIGVNGSYNTVTVRNTTIVGNVAGKSDGDNGDQSKGGGVYCDGGTFKLTNCILADNVTAQSGANIDFHNTTATLDHCLYAPSEFTTDAPNRATVTACASGAPKFVNAAAGNYTLASDSPAKGTGTTYTGIGLDLAGEDFTNPPSMGCYEFGSDPGSVPGGDEPPVVTPTAPVLGTVSVSAVTENSATLTGAISSVGNNGATACDVYLALNGGAAAKVLEGKTGAFTYTATGLAAGTAYTFSLTAVNNAANPLTSAAKTGAFTTTAHQDDPQPDDPPPAAGWATAHGTFAKRIAFTASGYAGSATLENFPVLVRLSSAITDFSYADCGTSGANILFTDASGNRLPHEIDTWNASGESLVWVKVAALEKGATFFMYFDGLPSAANAPSATWSGNYIGVWHMDEASGAVPDATGHNLTATPTGADGVEAVSVLYTGSDAPFGGARTTGTGSVKGYLTVPSYDDFSVGGTFTMSGWVRADGFTAWPRIFSRKAVNNASSGWELELTTVTMFSVRGSSGTAITSNFASPGINKAWLHVAAVFDGSTVKVYGNGVQMASGTVATVKDNDLQLAIGCNAGGNEQYIRGAFDECRLLKAVASADWIKAEYDQAGNGFLANTGVEVSTVPVVRPIVLGEPEARPGTDYNGNAVTVAFTGDIPEDAAVSAKVALGGIDYDGTVDFENGAASFEIPADAVTAGNTYAATVMLTVGTETCTKEFTLAQGTFKVDEDAAWIREAASSFGSTGLWSGDKATAASGKISVSNAVFTAATAAPISSVATIATTFAFGSHSTTPIDIASRAGIVVVNAGGVSRYAMVTAAGAVTNLSVAANTVSPVTVTVTLDDVAHTVAYAVDGVALGTYPMAQKAAGVSTVRYEGATEVAALNGAYRYEGLDTNLAQAGGVEYATVADAVAADKGTVELLWEATWNPVDEGDYTFVKNGHELVIGGDLAYEVTDNGDGTVTVSVVGGEGGGPAVAVSIAIDGAVVKIGVKDVDANLWYALEKTTDMTKGFTVDASTWTAGTALLAGTRELTIALVADEPRAFYHVIVSKTAP